MLHPWQQGHRADADAGKGEPHGESAAANEPVRQKQRLSGIAGAHAARADQHADREIEMPGLRRQRREQQAAAHQRDAEFHHRARTEAIHHAPDQRTDGTGNHEAKGKRARGDAAIPSELADDRRKEQRERRPRIDADRHGDERHRNDQPAVEERKTHRVTIPVLVRRTGTIDAYLITGMDVDDRVTCQLDHVFERESGHNLIFERAHCLSVSRTSMSGKSNIS